MLEQALALLERGRARIAQGWCQGIGARDSGGTGAPMDSPEAASWCVVGGLYAATPQSLRFHGVWDVALDALRERVPGGRALGPWNDTPGRTQAEVLALYDAAIADLHAKIEKENERMSGDTLLFAWRCSGCGLVREEMTRAAFFAATLLPEWPDWTCSECENRQKEASHV